MLGLETRIIVSEKIFAAAVHFSSKRVNCCPEEKGERKKRHGEEGEEHVQHCEVKKGREIAAKIVSIFYLWDICIVKEEDMGGSFTVQ